MSVNITQQGIVNASGKPNPNAVAGTSPNEIQYSYPSADTYSDRWATTTPEVASASQYTLSFYAKSTVSGDKIRAHWYYPNTTTKAETNQGVTSTSSDGSIDFTLSVEWQKYWVVWTQSSTTAVKRLIFPRMFGANRSEAAKGSGTVSIKMVKLEAGNIPTAWVPYTTDTNYVDVGGFFETLGCHIQENGYVEATEFIEW